MIILGFIGGDTPHCLKCGNWPSDCKCENPIWSR